MTYADGPNRFNLRAFFGKVHHVTAKGCWFWRGGLTSSGYASFDGAIASRVAHEWFTGPIPKGMEVDHVCVNKRCVNPAHLEAVTREENIRRALQRRELDKFCKRGHPRTPENTWANGNSPVCKVCVLGRRKAKRLERGISILAARATR